MTFPIRVLIVEDSPSDALLMLHALSRAGFDLIHERVETADELRTALAAGPWDAVLADYSLPEFGATAALEIVRVADPDIPFIVVSGMVEDDVAAGLMRAGASDYVLKENLTRLGPVVNRDVRERRNRQAHRVTERYAQQLAAIVAAADYAIISQTLDGIITTWNAGAERLYGYMAEEIIGQLASILLPPELPNQSRLAREKIGRGENVPAFDTVRLHKNGTRLDVSLSFSPVCDSEGRVIGVSGIGKDISERKRSEEALRVHEAKLAEAVRLARMGYWSRDLATGDLDWSDLLFDIFGVNSETFGRSFEAFLATIHPDDRMLVSERIAKAVEVIGAFDHTYRIIAHGKVRVIHEVGRVIVSEDGKPYRIAGTAQDVTERILAEDAIRASEERYRTLVAATSAIVWVTPESGEFEVEQPGWTAFTGQTFEQLRGWGWLNAIHPDDRENTAQVWRSAWARRATYRVEHRLRRADGEYREMSAQAVPILTPSGSVREWVGVHTDVTEHKLAEIERANLLTRLNLQIERMPLAYLLSGPDFRYTHWNPAAERMFGYTEDEVLGQHPYILIVPPQSKAFVADIFARLATGDMNAHGTSENITKDGRIITCEWHNTPLLDPDGTFQGILSVAQDITDKKRAGDALTFSEVRYRRLFEAALDGILIVDPMSSLVLDVNPFLASLIGYTRDELIGKQLWEFGLFRDIEANKEAFQTLQETGNIRYDDLPLQTKDGRRIDVEFVSNVHDVHGTRVIQCNIRDISVRKRAEDTLQLRDRAIQAATQGLMITDSTKKDNPIVYVSPSVERITGYLSKEVIGRNWRLLQGKDTDPEPVARLHCGDPAWGTLFGRVAELPKRWHNILE